MSKFTCEFLCCPLDLACDIGPYAAMVLDRLNRLCSRKGDDGAVMEDGRKWIFNTYDQWREGHFPFMSERVIKAIFQALGKSGLVLSCQPEGGKSRRKYYRVADNAEALLSPAGVEAIRVAMGWQPAHVIDHPLPHTLPCDRSSFAPSGWDILCPIPSTESTAESTKTEISPADPWKINDQQSKRDRGAAQAGLPKTGDRKNRKNVKSLEKADPRFANCVSGYCAAYKSVLGATYGFEGGRDGSALRVRLTQIPDTAEEISQLAKAAIKHHKSNPRAWHCSKASTLHGFCQNLNDIRAELAAAGISCKEPVYMESDPDAPTMQQFTNRNFRATLQAALSDPSVSEDRKASARNLLSTLPVL